MSSPRKLRLRLGLAGGILPLVFQLVLTVLLVQWLGGIDGLSRTLGMAGRSIHLMGLLSVLSTAVLSLVLFFLVAGRSVPVEVPVVLATVPWLAGAAGALRGARSVIEAVASVSQGDRPLMLIQGTGELLCAQLLGAWSSTALLLASAGALFMMRGSPESPSLQPSGAKEWNRKLEAGGVLLLAALCALAAFESKAMSDVLVRAVSAHPDVRNAELVAGALPLRYVLIVRLLLGVGLIVAGFALARQRRRRQSGSLLAFLSVVPLAVVVGGVLWADGRPLLRMAEALEEASLHPADLHGYRLLPFGGDGDVGRVDVIATAGGLLRPRGTEVPWSAGDKSLHDLLVEAAASVTRQAAERDEPSPPLALAVEAGVPVSELRRLIDLATQMDQKALVLVGTRASAAKVAKLPEGLLGTPPFFKKSVAAQSSAPGTVQVLLLPMLHSSAFTPTSTWVGELGAEHRVSLSEVPAGTKQSRTLELSGPDHAPAVSMPKDTLLHLTVTEDASLEDVVTAVRRLRAEGFTLLLSARPPPGARQP